MTKRTLAIVVTIFVGVAVLVGGLTYYFLTRNVTNPTPSETPTPTPTPTAPTPTAPPSGTSSDCVVAYND